MCISSLIKIKKLVFLKVLSIVALDRTICVHFFSLLRIIISFWLCAFVTKHIHICCDIFGFSVLSVYLYIIFLEKVFTKCLVNECAANMVIMIFTMPLPSHRRCMFLLQSISFIIWKHIIKLGLRIFVFSFCLLTLLIEWWILIDLHWSLVVVMHAFHIRNGLHDCCGRSILTNCQRQHFVLHSWTWMMRCSRKPSTNYEYGYSFC